MKKLIENVKKKKTGNVFYISIYYVALLFVIITNIGIFVILSTTMFYLKVFFAKITHFTDKLNNVISC